MIGEPARVRCSRAGCRSDAVWTVAWRNPRIHTVDRVKEWLACEEHRDFLADYLSGRGFPLVVVPFGTTVERVPDGVAR